MIEGCGKFRGYSENLVVFCRKHSLCEECVKEMYSSTDTKNTYKPISKTRVRCASTFEAMPKFFGFGDDVRFVTAQVNHDRNIISFYFTGDGLKNHYPEAKIVAYEGQECVEVTPPLW